MKQSLFLSAGMTTGGTPAPARWGREVRVNHSLLGCKQSATIYNEGGAWRWLAAVFFQLAAGYDDFSCVREALENLCTDPFGWGGWCNTSLLRTVGIQQLMISPFPPRRIFIDAALLASLPPVQHQAGAADSPLRKGLQVSHCPNTQNCFLARAHWDAFWAAELLGRFP